MWNFRFSASFTSHRQIVIINLDCIRIANYAGAIEVDEVEMGFLIGKLLTISHHDDYNGGEGS